MIQTDIVRRRHIIHTMEAGGYSDFPGLAPASGPAPATSTAFDHRGDNFTRLCVKNFLCMGNDAVVVNGYSHCAASWNIVDNDRATFHHDHAGFWYFQFAGQLSATVTVIAEKLTKA